ncbi:DUF2007 domain-containing protein [Paraflavitalea pollutisoli]|uniref:DUF2007 domain-containing protein n=1 Tax=Paraflavitalea pollutisoli TaxID=3034143 RepID=UPI0023EDEF1E|nr:DUF2007 domain-containing protein [Paraflavitalea sp. H1-2-19X]
MFVILRTYDNYIPANLMLQRLEEVHIRAYLQNELTDPIFANSVGGIKLMVHEGQLNRATELVEGFENLYREAISCRQCGSHEVQIVDRGARPVNWIVGLLARLKGRWTTAPATYYKCSTCGLEFDEQFAQQDSIYRPFKADLRENQQN